MATKKETKPKATKEPKEKKVEATTIENKKAIPEEEIKEAQAPKNLGSFKDSQGGNEEKPVEITKEEAEAAKSWREYKEDESAQEMGDRLQKQADEHKKKLEEVNSLEEIDKMEKEILEILDEFDKYIKQKRYKLPVSVMFDGALYTKEQVGVKIARSLNKKEVQWQYTLGLYQLYKLWSNIKQFPTIPYDAYDSTVRVLGDITFKGLSEWKDVLVINEFFINPNKEYYKDSTMLIYYSTLHSQILERKQILTPIQSETPIEGVMKEVK